ncbi:hypothetical protein LZ31DRAFT_631202 [Colletotrichum somersetense]|nr:hypothetical protein LZ31DRAFT_631202 [Colletotrichum somersetense]
MFHSSNNRRSPSVPAAAVPTPSRKLNRSCQCDGKSNATADTVVPVGRTPDIVAALYEAATGSAPSATTYSSINQFVQCDKQLTELGWATYLGGGGGVDGISNEGRMHQCVFAFS